MYLTYKITRGTIKAIVSDAAPWQIGLGAFLGTLLGFLPVLFPTPSPLGLLILALICLLNVHIGSALMFFAVGKGLSKLLHDPAVAIGNQFTGLAQFSADNAFLNLSHFNHTGYLGLTLLGVCFAPLFTILMVWFTRWFRGWLKAQVAAGGKLAKMGKMADRPILVRIACLFLGM